MSVAIVSFEKPSGRNDFPHFDILGTVDVEIRYQDSKAKGSFVHFDEGDVIFGQGWIVWNGVNVIHQQDISFTYSGGFERVCRDFVSTVQFFQQSKVCGEVDNAKIAWVLRWVVSEVSRINEKVQANLSFGADHLSIGFELKQVAKRSVTLYSNSGTDGKVNLLWCKSLPEYSRESKTSCVKYMSTLSVKFGCVKGGEVVQVSQDIEFIIGEPSEVRNAKLTNALHQWNESEIVKLVNLLVDKGDDILVGRWEKDVGFLLSNQGIAKSAVSNLSTILFLEKKLSTTTHSYYSDYQCLDSGNTKGENIFISVEKVRGFSFQERERADSCDSVYNLDLAENYKRIGTSKFKLRDFEAAIKVSDCFVSSIT